MGRMDQTCFLDHKYSRVSVAIRVKTERSPAQSVANIGRTL